MMYKSLNTGLKQTKKQPKLLSCFVLLLVA
jgi:hypothetical protein